MYVFDVYIDEFDGRHYTVRETCLTEEKICLKSIEGNFMMNKYLLFFVLINFQLSAKHFSVLSCYFMMWEIVWKNAEF